MSEIRADYNVRSKPNVQQIPLNVADCPKCGRLLSIWKVDQITQRNLSIRWRCDGCYTSTIPHHLEFVLS